MESAPKTFVCKKPSKCPTCKQDKRVGQIITYIPADAKPGQPRTWVHEGCA